MLEVDRRHWIVEGQQSKPDKAGFFPKLLSTYTAIITIKVEKNYGRRPSFCRFTLKGLSRTHRGTGFMVPNFRAVWITSSIYRGNREIILIPAIENMSAKNLRKTSCCLRRKKRSPIE
jgi:hypothetical protein